MTVWLPQEMMHVLWARSFHTRGISFSALNLHDMFIFKDILQGGSECHYVNVVMAVVVNTCVIESSGSPGRMPTSN